MAKRERKQKPAPQPKKQDEAAVEAAVDEEAQRLKDEAAALIDEIDAVLEENAEEFVRNYRQKGGE